MLKIILISIPFLFIIGSIFHFAYEWSNKNKIIGMIAPVNESIFEHSKLLLTPLVLFWGILYFFIGTEINKNSYFLAMLVSIVASIITMTSFYYTYKESIGKSYLLVDILDLLISLTVGQILANHVYVYSANFPYYISLIIIGIIIILFIYLTFKPLKIPLFFDKKNKIYGINKKQ